MIFNKTSFYVQQTAANWSKPGTMWNSVTFMQSCVRRIQQGPTYKSTLRTKRQGMWNYLCKSGSSELGPRL